ncbi:MAG: polymer-forming cytoskeletal protein [Akkermansia sp.]|nr:polymer-forming cytoskeletal protein [Akkermansia sp.]
MPEFKTEPIVVPSDSGLLPAGERDRRVALTSFRGGDSRVQVPTREVICYECGSKSRVPSAALSANCIHCHAHLNMADVEIRPGSRRLTVRTLGDVHVQPDTVLSHLSVVCRHMEVEGRVSGSFRCSGTLRFCESTRVGGTISARRLVVDKGVQLELGSGAAAEEVEVYGQLSGILQAKKKVTVYRGAVLEGNCKCPDIEVRPGGRYVGNDSY